MRQVNCVFRHRISMDRTVYGKAATCIWKPSRSRQRGLIIGPIEVDQAREKYRFIRAFWPLPSKTRFLPTSPREEKQTTMSAFYREKVLSVRHWTDTLFSFRATRDSGFRFQNGQFAMIGLEVEGRPLMRAYSMASANHEEELEFFSIKVEDGPLTSRLQKIREGDTILV